MNAGETAAAFLERALAFFAGEGVQRRRLLTDNGSPLPLAGLPAAAARARPQAPAHLAPPPQTNGKAEAFVKTLQNAWAYRTPYDLTAERIAALPGLLTYCNAWRPHGGLDGDTPLGRIRSTTS